MAQLIQTALNGPTMTIEELSDVGDTATSEFEGLGGGEQTTLAFVQSGKGVTHRLLHRLRILGAHHGFLARADNPFPDRPDYQPNRVPKKPNATVNKFCILSFITLPVWVMMTVIAARSPYNQPKWRVPPTSDRPGSRYGTLAVAALAVACWAALLPFTQPEQRLAHQVDQTSRTAGSAAALALMSAHHRADFPPDWQPPPRRFPGDPPTSEVLDSLEALADRPHPDWLGDLYARRFADRVQYDSCCWPDELLDQNAVRLAAILSRLREGPVMARALDKPYSHIEERLGPHQKTITQDQRTALETLLRLAGPTGAPKHRDEPAVDPAAGDIP